ncbi:hypothetical protein CAPTEDRAFT_203391 [Capitella teleta]|uniref:Uncharacterized protein n=1 Tax=Capitella teleta TaxID=283909 RepID=R7V9B8_CAPTE|nr:hypothetical protein CAPTEDRAFT_203391 [Capitella teleta]|eukprot:ELU15443.1 hypothetical protein CAPTEDRAFT_203391 [Capitella teleta]
MAIENDRIIADFHFDLRILCFNGVFLAKLYQHYNAHPLSTLHHHRGSERSTQAWETSGYDQEAGSCNPVESLRDRSRPSTGPQAISWDPTDLQQVGKQSNDDFETRDSI